MKKGLIFLTFCFATIGALVTLMLLPCFFMVEQYKILHFNENDEW